MTCGWTDDGEEAWCSTHLAEQSDRTRSKVVYEVRRMNGFSKGKVECGRRLRKRLVVPVGIAIYLGLDEVGS